MTTLRAYLLAKRFLVRIKKDLEERKDDMMRYNAPIEEIGFVNRGLDSVNTDLKELTKLAFEENKKNPDMLMMSLFCNEG